MTEKRKAEAYVREKLPELAIPKDGFGAKIALQHWLRVLREPTLTALGLRASVATFDTQGVLKGFVFDLTTGQPAKEPDYKAFNDIVCSR